MAERSDGAHITNKHNSSGSLAKSSVALLVIEINKDTKDRKPHFSLKAERPEV